MIYSTNLTVNLVVRMPPKTGSTTLDRTMRSLGVELHTDYGKHSLCLPKMGVKAEALPWIGPEHYVHYCTVRCPYRRMISVWKNMGLKGGLTLSQLLDRITVSQWKADATALAKPHDRPWRDMDPIWATLPQIVWAGVHRTQMMVLRLERLDYDLKRCPQLPMFTQVEWHNKTQDDTPWWEYYKEGDAERVAELYKDDFEQFQYSTNFEDAVNDCSHKPPRNL